MKICLDSFAGFLLPNFLFLHLNFSFLIPNFSFLKTDACPVNIENDSQNHCDHDEKQDNADQTAAAAALLCSECFLQPVVNFADQEQLKDARQASGILISSVIHSYSLFPISYFLFLISYLPHVHGQGIV